MNFEDMNLVTEGHASKFIDIVCEGGIKDIALVGALSVVEEHGFVA